MLCVAINVGKTLNLKPQISSWTRFQGLTWSEIKIIFSSLYKNIAIKMQSNLKRNIWGFIPHTWRSCQLTPSTPFHVTRSVNRSAVSVHGCQSICLNIAVRYSYKIWACQTSPNLAPWNIAFRDVFTWRTSVAAVVELVLYWVQFSRDI